jgi:hypothetical protein
MGQQKTVGLGKLAMPAVPEAKTLDDCVRTVTAFSSFDDLKATEPNYAPTIYVRGMTTVERQCARRVADAFNAWAARDGNRTRLAEVRS